MEYIWSFEFMRVKQVFFVECLSRSLPGDRSVIKLVITFITGCFRNIDGFKNVDNPFEDCF